LLLLATKALLKTLNDNTILCQINLIVIFNQSKISIPWLDSYPVRQQAAEETKDITDSKN